MANNHKCARCGNVESAHFDSHLSEDEVREMNLCGEFIFPVSVLIFPITASTKSENLLQSVRDMKPQKIYGVDLLDAASLVTYVRQDRPKVIIINGEVYQSRMIGLIESVQSCIATYDMDTAIYFLGKEKIWGVVPIDKLEEIKEFADLVRFQD